MAEREKLVEKLMGMAELHAKMLTAIKSVDGDSASPGLIAEHTADKTAAYQAAAYLRSEPERLAAAREDAAKIISHTLTAARNEAREQCAAWVENYPSPLDDLPMALTIRDLATGLRNLKEPQ